MQSFERPGVRGVPALPSAPSEPSGSPPDDRIDLQPYVEQLLRRWVVIVLIALAFGGAAFIMAILETRTYEATAVMMAVASKLDGTSVPLLLANFRPVVLNRQLAARLIERFRLDQAPYHYTPSLFVQHATQLDEIPNTGVLRLTVRMQQPELAAEVANALAEASLELQQSLTQSEAMRASTFLQAQRDSLSSRLDAASETLLAFKRRTQIDLLRADVASLVQERSGLLGLLLDIEVAKARISQAKQELAGRNRIDSVMRTLVEDPAMLEAARKLGAPPGVLHLQMRSEIVNRVYLEVDKQLAVARVELSELEKRREQIVERRAVGAADLRPLRQLLDAEAELARLEINYDIAQNAYSEAAAQYERARLHFAARSAELVIVDPAVTLDRPVSRQVVRRTVTAVVVGGALGAALVLLAATISTRRPVTRV